MLSKMIPKEVLNFFKEISSIPRESGNEKAISVYLVSFGTMRGLEVKQDSAHNVVIYKQGSLGYETHPSLILQSHMDMVCEKHEHVLHDFKIDPITFRVEEDFLYANGTTLGADNGIGMAISLAILDASNIAHPPLEVIFTSEEETTMNGMATIDATWLTARRMINLDSGNEKTFYVGCAGGGQLSFNIPLTKRAFSSGLEHCTLTVRNLVGGHSGVEIHLGRANSIRILGRVLDTLISELEISIVDVYGGVKVNVIPREASALIALPHSDVERAKQILSELQETLRSEYKISDPNIVLELTLARQQFNEAFTTDCVQRLIAAILLLPYGVLHMSNDIPELVETSSNIGVLKTTQDCVSFDCGLRSSLPSRLQSVLSQVNMLALTLGAKATFSNEYPSWTHNLNLPLLSEATALYCELYNEEASVKAVHAGLECGFMIKKIPDMDIISFCSQIYDAHTPNEHLSISSLYHVWKYIIALLKCL